MDFSTASVIFKICQLTAYSFPDGSVVLFDLHEPVLSFVSVCDFWDYAFQHLPLNDYFLEVSL